MTVIGTNIASLRAGNASNAADNMLQRARELAVQSASGTYSDDDRTNLQTEVTALTTQITSVPTNTQFNKVALFDGSAGSSGDVTIQAGATSADTVTVSFGDLDLSDATGIDISDAGDASDALDTIDTALATVNTARASFGAASSQLQSVVNNLSSNVENLSQARSGIQDADFSAETANLAKAQILSQASTAMLAQAHQSQQGVLSLLR